MDYPVHRFIKTNLDMTPYAFSKATGISQQSLSSWKSSNRMVNKLPIQLLIAFVSMSNKNYEEVIILLLRYEMDYQDFLRSL
ncbi:transcriptional regulator [Enterococcus sp. AZ072]|uniref:transcriptional regulator n=1 Tax=unclassified Enterococcus TaxID=2608891 RepID=UPI003D27E879